METLKDSQGTVICVGNKLRSSQGGLPAIKLISIEGNIGIFQSIINLFEEPFKMTQKSLENSKWIICKEVKE